jgi:hypothetical protein
MFCLTFVEGKHTVMNMEHSLERNVVFNPYPANVENMVSS